MVLSPRLFAVKVSIVLLVAKVIFPFMVSLLNAVVPSFFVVRSCDAGEVAPLSITVPPDALNVVSDKSTSAWKMVIPFVAFVAFAAIRVAPV